jgi:hypothetical protein
MMYSLSTMKMEGQVHMEKVPKEKDLRSPRKRSLKKKLLPKER